jgi:hypothetical protein
MKCVIHDEELHVELESLETEDDVELMVGGDSLTIVTHHVGTKFWKKKMLECLASLSYEIETNIVGN